MNDIITIIRCDNFSCHSINFGIITLEFPTCSTRPVHDDVIKWKHFLRYWPFMRRIHRFPVNSAHKGQWRGALMFSLISTWINRWVNNPEAGNLRRHRAHCDVSVMLVGSGPGSCTTPWTIFKILYDWKHLQWIEISSKGSRGGVSHNRSSLV